VTGKEKIRKEPKILMGNLFGKRPRTVVQTAKFLTCIPQVVISDLNFG